MSAISIRLWFGRLNIRVENGCVLFSERYGLMPSVVVGPFRFTWARYRGRR